ncbi:MFS general substrate transporter [Periconia macrospinosa]|uniref:MFS general substrate transporter n=1 Tax=Periconia macrospinosa TaxID=97972 RepID=A0A2V1E9B4_9PLEO|nr:MFS general substrate transporter [Periconia macrospinosa]
MSVSEQSTVDRGNSIEEEKNTSGEITKEQKWKVLIATSTSSFWVIGLMQSFGIWQRHYGSQAAVKDGIIRQSNMIERPVISTIGSFGNGGLIAAFAILYFPYLPRFGKRIREICIIATTLMAVGFGTAAASTHLWMLLLTQGLLVGLGGGIFLSTLAPILPEYFDKHSGLAQGVSLASASAGGTVLSLATPELLDHIGSRATLGVMCSISIILGAIVSALAQPPRRFTRRSNKMVNWKTFKDPMFTLLFLANLLHPLSVSNPATFGPEFSEALGLSKQRGSVILAIVSAVGLPARLVTGHVSDLVGHQNMLLLATAVYAVGVWGFWYSAAAIKSEGLWIGFSVLYGIINGTFNTVVNSAQKRLFGDEVYYPYNGAMTSIRGIGYFISLPIAGSLVRRVEDDKLDTEAFKKPICYTGIVLTLSVACLVSVRSLDGKRVGWKWAR